MKLGILFGGVSTEHDISIVSASSVIENLDKNKYSIYPIYISKEGIFYKYTKKIEDIKILSINSKIEELELIDNIINYLKSMDVIFPILHGKNGEDGSIQGLLELIGIPYVGCKILASSVCMDKVFTKKLLENANIKIAKYMYIKKINNNYIYYDNNFNEYILNDLELINKISDYLKYPVYVKASRSGSSIGVYKCNEDDVIKNINEAFKYDDKVLIEESIIGRELEVAVLGNNDLEVSNVGEILTDNFYTYEEKYIAKTDTSLVKDISYDIESKIKSIAKRAYLICDCRGLSRIDFFLDKNNNIILNEINTMPGFTSISMYPKLMSNYGYTYQELLDKLIMLATKK